MTASAPPLPFMIVNGGTRWLPEPETFGSKSGRVCRPKAQTGSVRSGHAASHGAVVRSSLFKVRPEALQAPRRARDAPPVVPPYLRSTRFQGGRRNPRPQGHDGDAVALRAPPRPGAPCGRSRPGVARPKARLPTVEQKRQLFLGPPAKSRGACRRRRRPRLTTCSLVREYRPGSLSGREGLGSPGRGRRLPADVRPTPGSSSGSGTRPAP
jgi:hypothetical protein